MVTVSSIVNLNILSIEWDFYIILEIKTLCFYVQSMG